MRDFAYGITHERRITPALKRSVRRTTPAANQVWPSPTVGRVNKSLSRGMPLQTFFRLGPGYPRVGTDAKNTTSASTLADVMPAKLRFVRRIVAAHNAFLPSGRSSALSTAASTLLTTRAFFAFGLRALRQQGRGDLVFRKRGEPLVKFTSDFERSIHRTHRRFLPYRCAKGLRGAPRGDTVVLRLLNRAD